MCHFRPFWLEITKSNTNQLKRKSLFFIYWKVSNSLRRGSKMSQLCFFCILSPGFHYGLHPSQAFSRPQKSRNCSIPHISQQKIMSYPWYLEKVLFHLVASDWSWACHWTHLCVKGNVIYSLIDLDLAAVLHLWSASSGMRPGVLQEQGVRVW